jgi:DNA (cytosine-5)-methyltransferase 1
MSRPLLLDLFCGAGGCAVGYHRAGFDVVGVDCKPQPRYPFPFLQADAINVLNALLDQNTIYWGECGQSLYDFAAIHASPPCQAYSAMGRAVATTAPKLIRPLRRMLDMSGHPYVIENVEGADLCGNVVMLCGTMFGLRVRRHRLFELGDGPLILTPSCQCRNGVMSGRLIGHRVGGKVAPGRTKPPPARESDRREAIGVPWMTTMEARQAIPPSYTECLGRQILAQIGGNS